MSEQQPSKFGSFMAPQFDEPSRFAVEAMLELKREVGGFEWPATLKQIVVNILDRHFTAAYAERDKTIEELSEYKDQLHEVIAQLRREISKWKEENELLHESLPMVCNRTTAHARQLVGAVARHDDGNGASHGCVEVTGVERAIEVLVAEKEQLRRELAKQSSTLKFVRAALDCDNSETETLVKAIEELRRELAELKDEQCTDIGIVEGHQEQVAALRAELAELKRDKERLDWLNFHTQGIAEMNKPFIIPDGLRSAIDVAMSEHKPALATSPEPAPQSNP